ncbi:hypothetical protein [Peribacillus loiseleuriae]|uniref:hypothetical protein n=1 Tax=Peribacillus loiseleuriae TaxID=1679170 RepID=UPI003D024F8E
MESIDWSPMKAQMDHMAIQLAVIVIIPLIVGLFVKFVLVTIKLPQSISNFIAIAAMLFVLYKTILIVLG